MHVSRASQSRTAWFYSDDCWQGSTDDGFGVSIAAPAPSLTVSTPQNGKLHKGAPVTGTVQTAATITSVKATPQGNHPPETISGTVTAGQTVDGVTNCTYVVSVAATST